jgi:2-polyprenyl-6-methoxyphenol hydroxylase-like FAD-dependent oxidoreductase
LALWLAKFGVNLCIIDKAEAPETTSRALAVQARTLELYRQLDLADAVVKRSYTAPGVNLWLKGQKKTHVLLEEIRSHLTPFAFLQVFPQNEHERLLTERLSAIGIAVERGVELIDFVEQGDKIVARLRRADGAEELRETSYLAGCDGALSTVRQITGTNLRGGKRQQVFYVADINGAGPAFNGELHVDLDEAHFLAIFPLAERGRGRLIGALRSEVAAQDEQCAFENVRERAVSHLKVEVKSVDWFATYRVRHQVAEHFRHGRAFLLGDAAHVHSPAGGQGLNAGIGDAVNLAWKLASVLKGKAAGALLDTYEPERKAFARLAAFADRAFTLGTAEGALAGFVRTQVTPAVLPALAHVPSFRQFMFRAASLVASNYRRSSLSRGKAGAVHGGDRLPWLGVAAAVDNYAPLAEACWQVHVYGAPRAGLNEWCEDHNVPLHVFGWRKEYERAGLARDALYLMRPDTYVALAELEGDAETAEKYFKENGIIIPLSTRKPPEKPLERVFVLKDFKRQDHGGKYRGHEGA